MRNHWRQCRSVSQHFRGAASDLLLLCKGDSVALNRHFVMVRISANRLRLLECHRLGHERLFCRYALQKRFTGRGYFLQSALILDLWDLLVRDRVSEGDTLLVVIVDIVFGKWLATRIHTLFLYLQHNLLLFCFHINKCN